MNHQNEQNSNNEISSGQNSPHVLDLSSHVNTVAKEVSGEIGDVRGGLHSVDIGLKEDDKAAKELIAKATSSIESDESTEAQLDVFRPFKAEYYGAELEVGSESIEAKVKKIEKLNEKLLVSNPAKMLKNYAGQSDPHVTARRYAAEIDQRKGLKN